MSPEGTISVSHLWKRFRSDRTRALLRDHYERLRQRLRGGEAGWRWALQDVNFAVAPGEAVGLVGSNGSGKSTLLKILTGVMYPYAGALDVRGRVGALIEVRAGVHPDLTGRENTYLFGSLLGLSRTEVARRFDDIVAFAELGEAIDRQVKFFSSGMQMRLGFAVAAFLEPDVLLVDEVLAVGDAAFQQKCLDRMRALIGAGTTLVLVSHDLEAVEATCERAIWLDRGMVADDGRSRTVLGRYRQQVESEAAALATSGALVLEGSSVTSLDGGPPRTGQPVAVVLRMHAQEPVAGTLHIGISEGTASPVFTVQTDLDVALGGHEVRCELPHLPLPAGTFYLWAGAFGSHREDILVWQPACAFVVEGPMLLPAPTAVVRRAPLLIESTWTVDGGAGRALSR